MANNNDKPEDGRAAAAARAKPRGNDRPFDLWLHKQLHAMYDEIASEPLPDDLLNLIEKDAAEQEKGGSDEPPKE
ncbi:NepR family anti-sigma factor [Reyranella sp.]|uniref:NepR family anti-sigma factor n=1 Tax=Reyranella sp. TaxID=1929291 RepID=UPI003D0D632F